MATRSALSIRGEIFSVAAFTRQALRSRCGSSLRDATTAIDETFFRSRIERAAMARRTLELPSEETPGFASSTPRETVCRPHRDQYADVLGSAVWHRGNEAPSGCGARRA